MDANKLKVLQDLPYTIKRVCGNCYWHEKIYDPMFTTCMEHTYHHLKHDEKRQLSINIYGCCPKHEWDEEILAFMHAYEEFKED